MKNKYAVKITNYYSGSNESDSCSYYHRDNQDDDNKVILFETENDAQEFIASDSIFADQTEVVHYSEMILNKIELIDFIGKVNDVTYLNSIVKDFCKAIDLYIEISYKYAIKILEWENGKINKTYLYSKNNNIVLIDTFKEAHFAESLLTTDDKDAKALVYQRIIKYDDITIVYDLYERENN